MQNEPFDYSDYDYYELFPDDKVPFDIYRFFVRHRYFNLREDTKEKFYETRDGLKVSLFYGVEKKTKERYGEDFLSFLADRKRPFESLTFQLSIVFFFNAPQRLRSPLLTNPAGMSVLFDKNYSGILQKMADKLRAARLRNTRFSIVDEKTSRFDVVFTRVRNIKECTDEFVKRHGRAPWPTEIEKNLFVDVFKPTEKDDGKVAMNGLVFVDAPFKLRTYHKKNYAMIYLDLFRLSGLHAIDFGIHRIDRSLSALHPMFLPFDYLKILTRPEFGARILCEYQHSWLAIESFFVEKIETNGDIIEKYYETYPGEFKINEKGWLIFTRVDKKQYFAPRRSIIIAKTPVPGSCRVIGAKMALGLEPKKLKIATKKL